MLFRFKYYPYIRFTAVTTFRTLCSGYCFQDNGLQILICGTCLTHFDIIEHRQVCKTTNMLDIVTALKLADKVINIESFQIARLLQPYFTESP